MLTPAQSLFAYRSGVGATWLLIMLTAVIDCAPRDVRTAEGLVPHFLAWLAIGSISVVALPSRCWQRLAWPHVFLLAALAVALLDMTLLYFVGICALNLTTRGMRSYALVGVPLSILAILQMVAVPAALLGVIGAYAKRGRALS